MIKHKKNLDSLAKKVNLNHSLQHHKAVRKIGKGVFLGMLVPVAVYYGLKHHKN